MDPSINESSIYVEETIVTTSEIIASAGEDGPISSQDIIATVVASDSGDVVSLDGASAPIHMEMIQMDNGEQIHIQTTAEGNTIQIQTVGGGDPTTMQLQSVDGIRLEEMQPESDLAIDSIPISAVITGTTQPEQKDVVPSVALMDDSILAEAAAAVAEEEDAPEADYEPGKGKEEIFPCEDCGVTLDGYDDYVRHQKEEHDNEINCDDHTWRPYYVIHTARGKRHDDDYVEFECPKCPLIASSQAQIDEHVEAEHKVPTKPRVQCGECEKTFARKYELATHVKKVHLGIRDQKCPQCNYCSADKGAVMKHLRAVHWGERNYPCPYCPYSSKTNGGIENHVKAVHLKLKDYVCEHCNTAFAQVGQLKAHIARRHLGEKNYQCSECDFRAINQSLVRRHIRVKHQKIKDFLCTTCGYGSTSKKQLESHIEKIHRNKKRRKLKPIYLQNGFRLKNNL